MESSHNTDSPPTSSDIDKSGIHPLKAALHAGQELKFGQADEPTARTIHADWLNKLIQSSDHTVSVPIRISGAIIEGKLDLRFATFMHELSITDSSFMGEVMLSFATFERCVNLEGAHFHRSVSLCSAHAKSDFSLTRACLDQVSTFDDFQVDGVFAARGANFNEVSFNRIKCNGMVLFDTAVVAQQHQRVCFHGQVSFADAEIKGPVYFNSACFKQDASFVRMRINSTARFNCYIARTVAQTASPGALPPSSTDLIPVQFEGPVTFDYAHVSGKLTFEGAEFVQKASFIGLRVDSDLDFSSYYTEKNEEKQYRCTQFGAGINMLGARVLGGAAFIGVEFKGQATLSFERIEVGGHLLFTPIYRGSEAIPVKFGGDVRFLGARVHNNAQFSGADFAGKAYFGTIEIGHNLFIRPAKDGQKSHIYATFHDEADFVGALVHGDAEFTSVQFHKKVRFESMHVKGIAYFNNLYFDKAVGESLFGGPADFTSAHFSHRAEFSHAQFENEVTFKGADFEGAGVFIDVTFTGNALFTGSYFRQQADFQEAKFHQQADFESVTIVGGAFFQETTFTGSTIFRAAHFKSLDFNIKRPTEGKNFGGKINLSGFTYDLIDINEDILGDLFQSLTEYNRQPYTQLEKVLRSIGRDDLADRTYLEQRRRQRLDQQAHKADWRHFWRRAQIEAGLAFDLAQKWVGNYGVRPTLRLVVISLVVVLFGTFIFSRKDAVERKEKESPIATAPASQTSSAPVLDTGGSPSGRTSGLGVPDSKADKTETLGLTRALGFSLNQFIPIVEIPSGNKWQPSQKLLPSPFSNESTSSYLSYAFYGTIHRILGAILMPLLVAALTGVLQHSDKSGR